jgi:hypothetical protein
MSNQPRFNAAALEAGADVHVPEVAARPTSRAYKHVSWLSATTNHPSAVMP